MKVILTFLSAVILSIIFWQEQILLNLDESEFKYKWLLFLKSAQFEAVITAVDKTPYSSISLCPDCPLLPDSGYTYTAWIKRENTHEKVKNPDLQEVIEVAKSEGLQIVRLRKYDGGWFIYASPDWQVNGNTIHAWMYFGLPPDNDNCEDLEEGISKEEQCHTHLFGNWYFNKYWSVNKT
ncbi:hypothetical protein [Paraglaciecola hydrolytica]|uniref:Uncharacterized protein n=1 Tax=Paraglaciecola hydrolytica TaxID=1799789 RepID=A0A148KKY2_9ALTE|nr:hypothetical protein [Paraglaciecola hydrolytica]KXI26963.1 hypothetical protein AX660_02365 [Paraglaciecola hydrolytica]